MPICVTLAHLSVAIPKAVSLTILRLEDRALDIVFKGSCGIVKRRGIAAAKQIKLAVIKALLSYPLLQKQAILALVDIGYAIAAAFSAAAAMLKDHRIARVYPLGISAKYSLADIILICILVGIHVRVSIYDRWVFSTRIRQADNCKKLRAVCGNIFIINPLKKDE